MASMIGSAQVDLEMLDQRGRRAWDTYTARLGDALDAAACRPCLNDPTFMVERRESELALTADRLSGAIVRSVGAFRSSFERLPERLVASTSGLDGKRHALTLAASPRPTWAEPPRRSMPCRRLRYLPAVTPSRTAMTVWLRAPRPLSRATPSACAWQTATWQQRSIRSSRPRFIAINL